MRTLPLLLLAASLALTSAIAQQQPQILPTVTAFECPKYPSKAESLGLQGMVQLQVTTDGHQVVDVKVTSGHPALKPDAVNNVRTWKFADHAPITFAVTYHYVHQGDFKRDKISKCSAKMELPTSVTVSTGHAFPSLP